MNNQDLGQLIKTIKAGKTLLISLAIFLAIGAFMIIKDLLDPNVSIVYLSNGETVPDIILYAALSITALLILFLFYLAFFNKSRLTIYENGLLINQQPVLYQDIKNLKVTRGAMVNVIVETNTEQLKVKLGMFKPKDEQMIFQKLGY